MVFGHNTNVKVGSTVYHVQTEDRGEPHALIDTTVYYQGRVLHRRTNNYFDLLPLNDDREQALKLRLDEQHHSVLEEMKSGKLQLALPKMPESAAPVAHAEAAADTMRHDEVHEPAAVSDVPHDPPVPEVHQEHQDAATPQEVLPAQALPEPAPAAIVAEDRTLHVILENAKSWLVGKRAHLQILIQAENGGPVSDAQVAVKIAGSADEQTFTGMTSQAGRAEISFDMPRLARPDVALEIAAEHDGAQGHLRYALRAKPKVSAV